MVEYVFFQNSWVKGSARCSARRPASCVPVLAWSIGIDGTRITLWGDSFASTNPRSFDPRVPYDAGPFPELGEPIGSLGALLGGLFDENVRAVYSSGGLVSLLSVLESPFCYRPAAVIAPGFLQIADMDDLVATLAHRARCEK